MNNILQLLKHLITQLLKQLIMKRNLGQLKKAPPLIMNKNTVYVKLSLKTKINENVYTKIHLIFQKKFSSKILLHVDISLFINTQNKNITY